MLVSSKNAKTEALNRPSDLVRKRRDTWLRGSPRGLGRRGGLRRGAAGRMRHRRGAIARPRGPHPALDWARSGAMALTGAPTRRRGSRPARWPHVLGARSWRCAHSPASAGDRSWTGPHARRASGDLRLEATGHDLAGRELPAAALPRRLDRRQSGAARRRRAAARVASPRPARATTRGRSSRSASRADSAAELVERARLLGLPVAEAGAPAASPPPWLRVAARGEPLIARGWRHAAGGRSLLAVGGAALHAAVGSGRRARGEGREPRPPGRRAPGTARRSSIC